ncbi:MAG: NUDIX domain-containing protein [Bacteroidales bacterium]|nr:NUDIX domain-containing protein [Bacteroidales bacterium]
MNETFAADLSDKEIFPIVDEQGNVVGKATRKECHSGTRLLHPVVHLHVFNAQGDIYLQKRSIHKFIQPGKWDTAVGGHQDYGETVEQALERETREELGFTGYEPHHLFSYVFDSAVERELVHTFYTVTHRESFDFDPAEVDEGRFWSIQEVKAAIGKGILTPNFEDEFQRILAAKILPSMQE